MVDPEAAGALGAADGALADGAGREAAGADAGVVVGAALGAVAARLAVGETVAALLHAAARPATVMMAAAMMVLECMSVTSFGAVAPIEGRRSDGFTSTRAVPVSRGHPKKHTRRAQLPSRLHRPSCHRAAPMVGPDLLRVFSAIGPFGTAKGRFFETMVHTCPDCRAWAHLADAFPQAYAIDPSGSRGRHVSRSARPGCWRGPCLAGSEEGDPQRPGGPWRQGLLKPSIHE